MASSKDGPRKRILLNAFDMFTVGHLSFGQWRRDDDRSATKRRDLSYWTHLAQVLERGDFNTLFIADTLGHYDTYKQSAEPCFRSGAQFPMADPAVVSFLLNRSCRIADF
jgi:alkanesulfonate monooxygenase SsuD/methylene tetrahydromethanopterin reductase-like flavin-dependent oxidoreductase (luciferase family)